MFSVSPPNNGLCLRKFAPQNCCSSAFDYNEFHRNEQLLCYKLFKLWEFREKPKEKKKVLYVSPQAYQSCAVHTNSILSRTKWSNFVFSVVLGFSCFSGDFQCNKFLMIWFFFCCASRLHVKRKGKRWEQKICINFLARLIQQRFFLGGNAIKSSALRWDFISTHHSNAVAINSTHNAIHGLSPSHDMNDTALLYWFSRARYVCHSLLLNYCIFIFIFFFAPISILLHGMAPTQ